MGDKKILFVGNILSKHKGSVGPSEKLVNLLSSKLEVTSVSDKHNKIWRFLDIMWVCLTGRHKLVLADTYSGQAFTIAAIAVTMSRLRGKKVLLVLRGGRLPEFYEARKNFVKWIFKGSDLLVSTSLFLRHFFYKEGYIVEYLPNFIDTEQFRDLGMERKPHSLLWVRAFSKVYNPDLAVRAFKIVLEKFPEASLTMVGPDDGLGAETRKTAADLGISDKISFTGPVDNEKLPLYYSTHAVFLNTTAYESFGMAVMEAGACGIPIVSTRVGELPILWKEDEEIVFTPDFSPESLANQIILLLQDPEKMKKLAISGNHKSEDFSWKVVEQRWLDVFQSFCK